MADAPALGAGGSNPMEVQVLSSAPRKIARSEASSKFYVGRGGVAALRPCTQSRGAAIRSSNGQDGSNFLYERAPLDSVLRASLAVQARVGGLRTFGAPTTSLPRRVPRASATSRGASDQSYPSNISLTCSSRELHPSQCEGCPP